VTGGEIRNAVRMGPDHDGFEGCVKFGLWYFSEIERLLDGFNQRRHYLNYVSKYPSSLFI